MVNQELLDKLQEHSHLLEEIYRIGETLRSHQDWTRDPNLINLLESRRRQFEELQSISLPATWDALTQHEDSHVSETAQEIQVQAARVLEQNAALEVIAMQQKERLQMKLEQTGQATRFLHAYRHKPQQRVEHGIAVEEWG